MGIYIDNIELKLFLNTFVLIYSFTSLMPPEILLSLGVSFLDQNSNSALQPPCNCD